MSRGGHAAPVVLIHVFTIHVFTRYGPPLNIRKAASDKHPAALPSAICRPARGDSGSGRHPSAALCRRVRLPKHPGKGGILSLVAVTLRCAHPFMARMRPLLASFASLALR